MNRPLVPAQARPAIPDDAIRIDLTMPVTRVGVGIFSFDPVEQMIGMPISEILSSLLRSPMHRKPSEAGPAVDVYPLALPDGEGAVVPLGRFGELGFKNQHGLLILTVPLQARSWVLQRFGSAIVEGPVQALSTDKSAYVAHFALQLRPGMKAAFPLGMIGEVGVESV
jgi:hypothetical protein